MSTWNNQEKREGQTSITYNTPIAYNEVGYYYDGKTTSVWEENTKTVSTWGELSKTASTWSNLNKN